MASSDDVVDPVLTQMTLLFGQSPDTCDPDGNVQEIEVHVTSGDLGADYYYVLSTKRWAVDGPEELVELLRRAKAALHAADPNIGQRLRSTQEEVE